MLPLFYNRGILKIIRHHEIRIVTNHCLKSGESGATPKAGVSPGSPTGDGFTFDANTQERLPMFCQESKGPPLTQRGPSVTADTQAAKVTITTSTTTDGEGS